MIDPNSLAHSELTMEYGIVRHGGGLTIRQEFAKAAMQGLSAICPPFIADKQGFAEECLARADALIAELNKEKP